MAGGRVFCIGNGTSRDGFDLERLRTHGRIYGCNALYRDFTPDVLCAVDQGIMHEIYQSGYCNENEAYFRDWTKVPAHHYEMMLYAGLRQTEVDEVKNKWDGLYENERGNATEFVMHGSNMAGIVGIIRQKGDQYEKYINKSYAYVSWQKPGDKAHSIVEMMDKDKDLGWACGAMSGYIAIKKEKPKELYLIGHDLKSNNNKVNNLYAGTRHYVTKEHAPTPHTNWIQQWSQVFMDNPDINFFKVNPNEGEVSQPIDEWRRFKNLSYINYPTLDKRLGL